MAFGIKEKVQLIFNITDDDYTNGVADVFADLKTMEFLKAHDLLDFDYSYEEGPTVKEFYDFLKKYEDKDIRLHLFIINPIRDDFRIGVKGILASTEYTTMEGFNQDFYFDFLTFCQKGDSHFYDEDNDYFGFYWFD